MPVELPALTVGGASAWAAWLVKNGTASQGVWLTLAKKGVTSPTSLTYAQAVDEALCHGWIDGQARSIDEKTYFHRFTPRSAKSIWSKINIGKVARLESEGRMLPAGRAAVEAAKADGRWEKAYDGPANATVSPEFLEALKKVPEAERMYEVLTKQNKYAIYHRLQQLKTEKGKTQSIQRFIEMLARGETLYPQKQKLGDTRVAEEEEVQVKVEVKTETTKGTKTGKGKRAVESEILAVAPIESKAKKPKVMTVVRAEVAIKMEEPTKPRREGLRQRKLEP